MNRERLLFRRLGKAAHLESSSKTLAYSSMKSTATATMSGLVIPAAGEIVTHGRLLRSTVTGLPVRLTSAVTREKLFLASARPMVVAFVARSFPGCLGLWPES